MFNAANKYYSFIAAIGATLIISACSGDKKAAESLRDQAAAAIEAADPSGALILLDSLDHAYPAEIETRRSALPLRPKAIELQTINELVETDSLLAETQVMIENLQDAVKFKAGHDGVDGFYVATAMPDGVPSEAEGLYPRMSPEGSFYIISSAKKGTLSEAIKVSDGTTDASTPRVKSDGERNDRTLAAELITFFPAESDTIGKFILSNHDKPIELTFIGERNSRSVKMKPEQVTAIAQLYGASQVFSRARLLNIRKNKLEQQLMLARSQQARITPDK